MKKSLLILILIISQLLIACSLETPPVEKVDLQLILDQKLSELQNTEGFDHRENIFNYQLDTNATGEIIFSVRTTDERFSRKAIELAKQIGFERSELLNLPIDQRLISTPYGVISQSVANMRVGQSRTKGMATQTLMGMQLELLEVDEEGFWHKARNAQGYIGWIPKPSFEYLSQGQADSLRSLPKVMVTAATTFAYDVDNNRRVVTDLVYGNVLTLIKNGNNYTEVMIPDGRRAIVNSSEVTSLKEWQQQAKFDTRHLVDFAYGFNGQPYLWGGNSLKGVDCSGFSSAVYYSMGMFLPRDASQQIKQGTEIAYSLTNKDIKGTSYPSISTENLEVGDLLFFGDQAKGKVTHVAIWIGNDEFIHSSGRVHVTSIDPSQPHYKAHLIETLLGVRRIAGSENLDKTTDLTATSIWF
jgi:cell wall-associated NlpC family hydrolase